MQPCERLLLSPTSSLSVPSAVAHMWLLKPKLTKLKQIKDLVCSQASLISRSQQPHVAMAAQSGAAPPTGADWPPRGRDSEMVLGGEWMREEGCWGFWLCFIHLHP